MTPAERHAAAVAAIGAGLVEEGRDALRELVAARLDPEHVDDLAVAAQTSGRLDEAGALLESARVLRASHPHVEANLALLAEVRAARDVAWRSAPAVGGTDPRMWERASSGMPNHGTMGEHCVRYAYAMSRLGGLDVLDLGCGTGHGAEMLTWSAARVRGYDVWEPADDQRPRWPGAAELHYGHDLCRDPLPRADAATMFEVVEHLPDAPAALRLAWRAVHTIVASFPNPVHHGSPMSRWHFNDWTLDAFEQELRGTGGRCFASVELEHLHQPLGSVLLRPGRDPDASLWVVFARGRERRR